jgi:hypothetical protein
MAGPGDEVAAAEGRGRDGLRASHADREQVIATLKAAFVQGRLDQDEFDLRVGQALASRTYADLAAVTADLPAGLAAANPPLPARAQSERRGLRPALVLIAGTVAYAAVWPVAFALPVSGPDHDPHAGIALAETATVFYLIFLVIAGVVLLDSWLPKRSGRQLPPGSAPGGGDQAPQHLPSAGPGRQLPPGDQGRPRAAEAARRRRPARHCRARGHYVDGTPACSPP